MSDGLINCHAVRHDEKGTTSSEGEDLIWSKPHDKGMVTAKYQAKRDQPNKGG